MKNLFDTNNYPDGVPSVLYIGSAWGWKNSQATSVYPTDTYTLSYIFSSQSATVAEFEVMASKVDSEHVVDASDTSSYGGGDYRYQVVVTRDSDSAKVFIDEGFISLSLAADGGNDTRSHNYKVLQAIRSTIEGTATKEQESYSIAGRSLSRRSIEDLMALEREYLNRWNNEKQQLDMAKGRRGKSRVLVSMGA